MKEIYLIIRIIEWSNGEKTVTPLWAVGDKITAKNECLRMQDEEKHDKFNRTNYQFQKIKFFEF